MHLALVDGAVFRIEYLATLVLVAVALHSLEDRHAEHRLVLAGVGAFIAGAIGLVVGTEALDDLARERAVCIWGDLHERLRLAGMIVDGLPDADRGIRG